MCLADCDCRIKKTVCKQIVYFDFSETVPISNSEGLLHVFASLARGIVVILAPSNAAAVVAISSVLKHKTLTAAVTTLKP